MLILIQLHHYCHHDARERQGNLHIRRWYPLLVSPAGPKYGIYAHAHGIGRSTGGLKFSFQLCGVLEKLGYLGVGNVLVSGTIAGVSNSNVLAFHITWSNLQCALHWCQVQRPLYKFTSRDTGSPQRTHPFSIPTCQPWNTKPTYSNPRGPRPHSQHMSQHPHTATRYSPPPYQM